MKHRILALALAACLILALAACSRSDKQDQITEPSTTPHAPDPGTEEDIVLGQGDDTATRPVITGPVQTQPSEQPEDPVESPTETSTPSASTEPAPKPTEPTPTEPKPTEPKPTESKPTEPKPTTEPTAPPEGNVGVEDSIFG